MTEQAWVDAEHPAPTWPATNREPRQGLTGGGYCAAVTPSVADIADITLGADLRSLIAEATVDLVRFDVEFGAMSRLLLLAEATASSRIEGVVAKTGNILLAESGTPTSGAANLVAANVNATRLLIDEAERLGEDAVIRAQSRLLGEHNPRLVGRFRDAQVWIGAMTVQEATFVPPHHDRVRTAMADLIGFARRSDLAPIAHAAVAHAHFETIHPFLDGNGRIGRGLIHALLRRSGLIRASVVPLSSALAARTGDYFAALTAYRDGHVEPIVRLLCSTMTEAIGSSRAMRDDLAEIRAGWDETINARRDATVWKAADLLASSMPVLDSPALQRTLGVSAPVALTAIEQLADAGVVVKVSGEQRYRRYAAPQVASALARFGVR